LYDLNGDGTIVKDELVTVLHNIKPTISKENQDDLKIGAKFRKWEARSFDDSNSSDEIDSICEE